MDDWDARLREVYSTTRLMKLHMQPRTIASVERLLRTPLQQWNEGDKKLVMRLEFNVRRESAVRENPGMNLERILDSLRARPRTRKEEQEGVVKGDTPFGPSSDTCS